MPKKPKHPPGAGRPSSGRDAKADVHEEFWDRPRKTRREDRKSKRRRGDDRGTDTPPGGAAEIFGDPPPEPPAAPPLPPRPPRGRGAAGDRLAATRRTGGPSAGPPRPVTGPTRATPRPVTGPTRAAPRPETGPTPATPRPAPTAPTPLVARQRGEPPAGGPAFRNPRPPAGPGAGSRPDTSSRPGARRPPGGRGAGGAGTGLRGGIGGPGVGPATAHVEVPPDLSPPRGSRPVGAGYPPRPRRPSGEVPSLDTRLEGLASRGRGRPGSSRTDAEPGGHGAAGPPPTYGDSYDEDVYDYDDEAPPPRGRLRLGVALLAVAAVLVVTIGAAGLWVRGKLDPSGSPGAVVTVEIAQGQSTSEIGQQLEDAGVITSATLWTWYVRFKGGGDIQAGVYDLNENMSMGEALGALEGDPIPQDRSVTIAEGLTIEQMIERLTDPEDGVRGFDADRLRQAITGGTIRSRYLPEGQANPEGTLFPDTYSLGVDDDEEVLVEAMVTQMDTVLQELRVEQGAQALGRTPYEILIIASMIEREARIAEERPMIARVIYNRLAADMPLGIDAASCYESGQCPPSAAELESDSPYNTRRNPGLPPTPIAAPSRDSIAAALAPAEGEWLYFVVNDTAGHHTFSVTDEEHQAAVQHCRDQGLC